MKIVIATTNKTKIEGARKAFSNYYSDFELIGIKSDSEVRDQPVNEEIYEGAKNRIKNLKQHCKDNNIMSDLYISIESGITNQLGKWLIINYALIEDNSDFSSYGTSAGFPVPEKYVNKIIETNLSDIMDSLFDTENIGSKKGGIGILTKDIITRDKLTSDAFVMALTQYINEKWSN